jgi:predicted nucleic acid-binding protein
MTAVIADTDILSTFAKVGRLDLLLALFHKVYIASAVYHELLQAERVGLTWVRTVTQVIEPLPLTCDENRQAEHLFARYPQLGSGEIESFARAQSHRLICLTNDRQAKAVARALSLSYLDLEEILRLLKRRKMMATEALAELIDQIELQDHTRIKAKEQILSD